MGVYKFIEELESMLLVNPDSALVYIFCVIDSHTFGHDDIDLLFIEIMGKDYGVDVWISFLASTIGYKDIPGRRDYYFWVKSMLERNYDESEVFEILKGL